MRGESSFGDSSSLLLVIRSTWWRRGFGTKIDIVIVTAAGVEDVDNDVRQEIEKWWSMPNTKRKVKRQKTETPKTTETTTELFTHPWG